MCTVPLTREYKVNGVCKDIICKVQIVVGTAAANKSIIRICCSKSANDFTSPVLSGITVSVLYETKREGEREGGREGGREGREGGRGEREGERE